MPTRSWLLGRIAGHAGDRRRLPHARAAVAALMVILAVAGSGCDIGYIGHAAYEEARILCRRRPIDQVLAKKDLPPEIRARLKTVLAARNFAKDDLGMNVGRAYKSVSNVDKSAIVWVVMAAPRTSLKPYEWWFPIVGNVPYRGYFNKSRAAAEAASMEARGYDTYVRPAVAFSSLGFFNDPLLSNMLALNHVELAGVIIHELFHRTYFLAGNATFDESAATWVGNRGALDFFTSTEGADSADARAARGIYDSDMEFAAFLLQQQARLLRLYQSGLPKNEILKRRVKIFAAIKKDYARLKPHLSGLERFDLDRVTLNNAVLLNYMIYFHDLDKFAALERINHGNLRATIKEIIRLAKSEPDDPFHAIWKATLNAPLPPKSHSTAGTMAAEQ